MWNWLKKVSVFTFTWHNCTNGKKWKNWAKMFKGEQGEKLSNMVLAGKGERLPKIKRKRTLLVPNFAKKDSSVFNQKNGHSYQVKTTTVNKRTLLSSVLLFHCWIFQALKRTVLTILSYCFSSLMRETQNKRKPTACSTYFSIYSKGWEV